MKRVKVQGSEEQIEEKPEPVEGGEDTQGVFPSEYLLPLNGLMYLGKLEKEVEYCHHTFKLRTLTIGERMRIGVMMQKYNNTIMVDAAFKTAVLSFAITLVDGQPLYQPIGEGETQESIEDRRLKIVMKWFPLVVDFLYQKVLDMDVTVETIAGQLKK